MCHVTVTITCFDLPVFKVLERKLELSGSGSTLCYKQFISIQTFPKKKKKLFLKKKCDIVTCWAMYPMLQPHLIIQMHIFVVYRENCAQFQPYLTRNMQFTSHSFLIWEKPQSLQEKNKQFLLQIIIMFNKQYIFCQIIFFNFIQSHTQTLPVPFTCWLAQCPQL